MEEREFEMDGPFFLGRGTPRVTSPPPIKSKGWAKSTCPLESATVFLIILFVKRNNLENEFDDDSGIEVKKILNDKSSFSKSNLKSEEQFDRKQKSSCR